ncbi:MAG: DmsE family decaheme c-type cytochrome [Bryobacteraceae bacterium]
MRNPSKTPVRETDKGCLSCHMGNATHAGRVQGSHARNQVGCTSCHSVHKPSKTTGIQSVNGLCATCHTSVWASFQRPQKHRLPEGAMSCVDCHNPHGGLKPGNMRIVAANEPGCFKCHADKRGPYTFEHSPVRVEGCAACHEPHGSANPRMLARAEVRFQCLECHSNIGSPNPATGTVGGVPPAFHDLRSARYRACTTCHIKIHGSHVSKALLR